MSAGTPIAERWAELYEWAAGAVVGHEAVIANLIEELSASEERERVLREALDKARAANERDRTALHKAVSAIDEEINGRMWLLEGRGPYEWDDDRYRQEFVWAIGAIRQKIEVLRKIAGDLTNCPTTKKSVDAARAALATPAPEQQKCSHHHPLRKMTNDGWEYWCGDCGILIQRPVSSAMNVAAAEQPAKKGPVSE